MSAPLFLDTGKSAVISEDGLYRYQLSRQWGTTPCHALWVMLNPSTADSEIDDPTIRRCIGFTRRLGLDALTVVNLYALRVTRPVHLEHHPDPIGPDNDSWINASLTADITIAAWGAYNAGDGRDGTVTRILDGHGPVHCLGHTKDGAPRHPLYVRASTDLVYL